MFTLHTHIHDIDESRFPNIEIKISAKLMIFPHKWVNTFFVRNINMMQ